MQQVINQMEETLSKAGECGYQAFYIITDGHTSHSGTVGEEKLFICPHTILSRIAAAHQRYWGRMCRLASDIAGDPERSPAELAESHDASVRLPARCVELSCQSCVIGRDKS